MTKSLYIQEPLPHIDNRLYRRVGGSFIYNRPEHINGNKYSSFALELTKRPAFGPQPFVQAEEDLVVPLSLPKCSEYK